MRYVDTAENPIACRTLALEQISATFARVRGFDFLVIGAGQSGTTSLWQALDSHPQIRVPADKERGFFNSDERYARGVEWFISWTFKELQADQLAGTVTPQLMPGSAAALDMVVARIAETSPGVKLIALLRHPIDRAVSHFRRGLRGGRLRGSEDFGTLIARREQEVGGLEKIPILAIGQYGRILNRYLAAFDRRQLLVIFTEELETRPDILCRRIFEFLGVDPTHHVEMPHMNVGGTKLRVSPDALEEVFARLTDHVWPAVSDPEIPRGFTWWMRHIWNIEPDDERRDVPADLYRRLAEMYLADARLLSGIGVNPPWTSSLKDALEAR